VKRRGSRRNMEKTKEVRHDTKSTEKAAGTKNGKSGGGEVVRGYGDTSGTKTRMTAQGRN